MERFSTELREQHPQLYYEHLHRYLLAKENISGGTVVDMACGVGYGSYILSEIADKTIGLDVSDGAIAHAKQTYRRKNLKFLVADCCATGLPDHSADFVVSYETIEHLKEPTYFLSEILRILKPSGILFLSSPDKGEYSDKTFEKNPFHLKELYHNDFKSLLKGRFAHCLFAKQRLVAGSHISPDPGVPKSKFVTGTFFGDETGGGYTTGVPEGKYSFAVCSQEKFARIKLGLYENKLDSAVAWDAKERIAPLTSALDQTKSKVTDLQRELLERDQSHEQLNSQVSTCLKSISDLPSLDDLETANNQRSQELSARIDACLDLVQKLPSREDLDTSKELARIKAQNDECLEELAKLPSQQELKAATDDTQAILKQQLDQLAAITSRNETIERAERRLEELQLQLTNSETLRASGEAMLKGVSETLRDIEEQNFVAQRIIREHANEIRILKRDLATRVDYAEELETIIAERDRDMSETNRQLEQVIADRNNFERRFLRLQGTFSWKSTVPLRAARRFFERFRT